ncbi:MAG: hypothetical protein E7774_13035 [Bradyrhizobium sp.]|nr:MAG: hypothetical protein E7774_13035 [Bradyrhizobium sp.]
MWVSAGMHAGLLAFIVFGFAFAPKFDDAAESIPVDAISQTQFNEIMKGERDATPVKEVPPAPPPKPVAEAPPPPPPPELKTADTTPPPPLPPVETPAAKPDPTPAPPPKPTAEDAPLPPPPRPKETPPPKPKPDALAKLLEKAKDEPPPKLQKTVYDPNAIAKLIGDNKSASADPTPTASTPRGLPTQNAPRMSVSQSAGFDDWLLGAYRDCWTPPPSMPAGDVYVARVQVAFNPDGSLAGTPILLNPPSDPAWRAHAESAMRAVQKCNPLRVPAQYAPFFDQWRSKTVDFDPSVDG